MSFSVEIKMLLLLVCKIFFFCSIYYFLRFIIYIIFIKYKNITISKKLPKILYNYLSDIKFLSDISDQNNYNKKDLIKSFNYLILSLFLIFIYIILNYNLI